VQARTWLESLKGKLNVFSWVENSYSLYIHFSDESHTSSVSILAGGWGQERREQKTEHGKNEGYKNRKIDLVLKTVVVTHKVEHKEKRKTKQKALPLIKLVEDVE
jgi:hypothetical protein